MAITITIIAKYIVFNFNYTIYGGLFNKQKKLSIYNNYSNLE